jgi:hypothetical protein
VNPLLWRHTVGLFFVVGLSACAVSARAPATDGLAAVETDQYRVPAKLDDGWDTGAADVAGMDTGRLVAMTSTIRRYPDWNIHPVLVERRVGELRRTDYLVPCASSFRCQTRFDARFSRQSHGILDPSSTPSASG